MGIIQPKQKIKKKNSADFNDQVKHTLNSPTVDTSWTLKVLSLGWIMLYILVSHFRIVINESLVAPRS